MITALIRTQEEEDDLVYHHHHHRHLVCLEREKNQPRGMNKCPNLYLQNTAVLVTRLSWKKLKKFQKRRERTRGIKAEGRERERERGLRNNGKMRDRCKQGWHILIIVHYFIFFFTRRGGGGGGGEIHSLAALANCHDK